MRYRPELDGLRAVAVLAVIAYHSGLPLAAGGWMGVDVFFVLSGYLITSLLLAEHDRTGGVSLQRFYARRMLRLYPALMLLCLGGAAFWWVLSPDGSFAGYAWSALAALLYVGDFVIGFRGSVLGGLGHTWSLAVEEQFYLLWPVALLVMLRAHARVLRWTVLLTAVCFATLAVSSFFLGPDHDVDYAYFLPWSRFATILLGCTVALLLHRGVRVRFLERGATAWAAVGVAIGVTVVAGYLYKQPNFAWEAPLVALAAAALVWNLTTTARSVLKTALGVPPLTWLGRRSYGVYLYHFPIVLIVGENAAAWHLNRTEYAAIVLFGSVIIAATSYRFVERPLLRLKASIGRPRPVAPAVPPVGVASAE
ncbi:acyltransferase family protein [Gryllotalpicola ginsengisoli]|uniref:acyltransferase family protein n=1 Tax=Gryllotalpicola ginsengisoli TaxID=444608 RepID=UPI0003B79E89|nr:acyltransferase [Gryllotalpicola ginsengisoli]